MEGSPTSVEVPRVIRREGAGSRRAQRHSRKNAFLLPAKHSQVGVVFIVRCCGAVVVVMVVVVVVAVVAVVVAVVVQALVVLALLALVVVGAGAGGGGGGVRAKRRRRIHRSSLCFVWLTRRKHQCPFRACDFHVSTHVENMVVSRMPVEKTPAFPAFPLL